MKRAARVLVTGGAGYIGSHTCKRLAQDGFECIVYDNLSTGFRHNVQWGPLVIGDILDRDRLDEAIQYYRPDAVVHFAALAYVGESVVEPKKYYRTNVTGTQTLLAAMRHASVDTIVFSSTCATYGIPQNLPITEGTPQNPINPYGASKLMVERILADFSQAYGLKYAALRYFNACGADPEGALAEEHDPETHLIPRCLMAAAGQISEVELFGDDYPTQDGTCIRDYIHVSDLAAGHALALTSLLDGRGSLILNLGTGSGYSVRQIVDCIQRITGNTVPCVMRPRRPGDPPALLADISAAKNEIGFIAQYSDLDTIVRTAWNKFKNELSN